MSFVQVMRYIMHQSGLLAAVTQPNDLLCDSVSCESLVLLLTTKYLPDDCDLCLNFTIVLKGKLSHGRN